MGSKMGGSSSKSSKPKSPSLNLEVPSLQQNCIPATSHLIKLIFHRPTRLFSDEDDLVGHEFFEEIRSSKTKKWTLKKIARRHLNHLEYEKLDIPTILGTNNRQVLIAAGDIPTRSRMHKND